MTNPQEIGQKVQDETLEAVRKVQDTVIDAVTTWSEAAKNTPKADDFTKQFPTFAELIDSNFDFAQRILNNQREFAHRIIAAATPAVDAPAAKVAGPKAVEPKALEPKAAEAPAKKPAPVKKAAATRQPSAATT